MHINVTYQDGSQHRLEARDGFRVMEIIRDSENGWLVDFFDAEGLAKRAANLLAHRTDMGPVRRAARETIRDNYDLHRICLPKMLKLLAPTTDTQVMSRSR